MIYPIRNTETFGALIVGFLFIGLPASFFATKLGVEVDQKLLLLFSAIGALIILLLTIQISNYFLDKKLRKATEYYNKNFDEIIQKARIKYPITQLKANTPDFDRRFESKMDYEDRLRSALKEEIKNKFKLSKRDWDIFLLKLLRNSD